MTISRRDFLKLGAASVASMAMSRFTRRSGYGLPLDWKLGLKELIPLPSFYKTPNQDGYTILTNQNNPQEYDNGNYLYQYSYNMCGFAALTAATKFFHYCEYGEIPYVTIYDTFLYLDVKRYIDINGDVGRINGLDYGFYFDALKYAVNQYLPLGDLVEAKVLSTDWGSKKLQPLDRESEWPDVFSKAEKVCQRGGAILMSWNRNNLFHLVMCTDFKSDGSTLVVDSGIPDAYRVNLPNWLKKDQGQEIWGVLGLTPKIETHGLSNKIW